MNTPHDTSLERLLGEEPFVRMLARTLLAEEADDVVQQTWLHAMRSGGHGIAEPRSWLARIVHNVASNLRRSRRRREQNERDALAAPRPVPSSAELLVREEGRRELVAAVDALPVDLRSVVLLRYFDGVPPRRIARQLDLPVTTVWNRLRRALLLLREQLDARHHGQRRAWLLPLIPFALGGPGTPVPVGDSPPAKLGHDGITTGMPTKAKTAAAATLLLAGGGAFLLWTTAGRVTPPSPPTSAAGAAENTSPAARTAATTAPASLEQATRTVASAATAGGSSLVVHVRHDDDGTAAPGVTVLVTPRLGDQRVDAVRQVTDANGDARFEQLPAGRFHVVADRRGEAAAVDVDGKNAAELAYRLAGITVQGVVVDRGGASVPHAMIELAPLADAGVDTEVVASADADGRFVVRGVPCETFLGARAPGHASSQLQLLQHRPGDASDLRLQLGGPAGTVTGTVVDGGGKPVPRAILRIGAGATASLASVTGMPPVPATVRTDEEGRFTAVGIPTGTFPVVARSAELAPWQGSCEVKANGTTTLRVRLAAGATVRGVVRDAAGAVAAGARVLVGEPVELASWDTTASVNGEYELRGLPAGTVVVVAKHERAGRARQSVALAAGASVRCELSLHSERELRGRVVDDRGAAVAKARIECVVDNPGVWIQQTSTGADGSFVVTACPPEKKLVVTVRGRGLEALRRAEVDPSAGPVEFQVQRAAAASVRMRGIVVDPAGKPLANVSVVASDGKDSQDPARITATGADGGFELGPLPPGKWTVTVASPLHPPVSNGPRELAADAVWNLGTLALVQGGTVTVRADGDLAAVRFVVVDANSRVADSFSMFGPTPLESSPLAPGDYRLTVIAPTVAADVVPFAIKAGTRTEVSVQLQAGVVQPIVVDAEAMPATPPRVRLRVHRGAELVAVRTLPFKAGKRVAENLCLLPGDYRVAAFDGEREVATATFTVGATAGAPLQLVLR